MKRKIIVGIVLLLFLLTGINNTNAMTVSSENIITKPKVSLNEKIFLGQVKIDGDGTQENSSAEAYAMNDLLIKTKEEVSYLDFYIDFDMLCDGNTDSGSATIFLQINGIQIGHDENLTFTENHGELIIENVEVKWGDILTFEVGALYTNGIPPFTDQKAAVGGGAISKVRSHSNNIFERINMEFPIFKYLLNKSIFNRYSIFLFL